MTLLPQERNIDLPTAFAAEYKDPIQTVIVIRFDPFCQIQMTRKDAKFLAESIVEALAQGRRTSAGRKGRKS
jgi:hypothetical protein